MAHASPSPKLLPEYYSALAETLKKTFDGVDANMPGPCLKKKGSCIVLPVNKEIALAPVSDALRKRIREFNARRKRERNEGVIRWIQSMPNFLEESSVDKSLHLGNPEKKEEGAGKLRKNEIDKSPHLGNPEEKGGAGKLRKEELAFQSLINLSSKNLMLLECLVPLLLALNQLDVVSPS